MLTIDMGVPLKRPVMVKNPRSDDSTNGFGFMSKKDAIPFALDGDPTVIMRFATSPGRTPKW